MFSGTSALLTRALRLEARLLRAHLFRLFFVCLIGGYLLLVTAMSSIFGAPGLRFFQWIAYLNFALISLAAVSFFATTVTEEKEEGTLELLKLAGINRLGLLLGKSTARLIGALLLLLVQFPFTLLAITLGGVTMGQVVAAYLALAAYMIVLANAALFCSVLCRRSGSAAALMTLSVVLYFWLPGLLLGVSAAFGGGRPLVVAGWNLEQLAETVEASSILTRLGVILTTGFGESPFSLQVVSSLAAAAIWFGLSWASFDLLTRQRDASAPYRGLPATRRGLFAKIGPGRCWTNALMWKDFHFVTGGTPLMAVKLIVYALILGLIAVWLQRETAGPFPWSEFARAAQTAMLVALAIECSVYASRIFHDELKWKTLSGVMMAPVSVGRLAWSKTAGCLLALFPATAYLTAGSAVTYDSFLALLIALISPSVWSVVLVFAVFLHVTALLSLYVKWGALPLALAIMFVSNCISSIFTLPLLILMGSFGSSGREFVSLPVVGILLGVILGLQYAIARRLQEAAA